MNTLREIASTYKFVVHKEHDSNYGHVFTSDGVTYYSKVMNVRVNQGKSAPKVVDTQQSKVTPIPDSFCDHFKEITRDEWIVVDGINWTIQTHKP